MSQELLTEVDVEGLNKFASNLLGVVQGMGGKGDIQRFIQTEAGLMADTIQSQLGPKTKGVADIGVENNVKTFLNSSFSEKAGCEKYNVFTSFGQLDSNYANFQWLASGPNWLLGIKSDDYQMDWDTGTALKNYQSDKKIHGRGKAYIELGTRNAKNGKHQHILQLNRTRVSSRTFKGVVANIKAKVGQARASFAFAASQLLGKTYPAWIARHFPGVDGKAIYDGTLKDSKVNPVVIFGSRAKGVQSNPYIVNKIARAVEFRKRIIVKKINDVLKGYTYDFNTGRVFRERVPEGGLPD